MDQAFIINGELNLACANFIFNFQIHHVKNEKICFGSYPESVADIKAIKKASCSTIFNLQTKEEMTIRNIDDV